MIHEGAMWPPNRGRIQRYRDYEALYKGAHHEVSTIKENLNRRLNELGVDQLTYLVNDFPKLVVNIPVNLLVGSPPVISYLPNTPEAEALVAVMKRSKFQSVLLEMVQDSSVYGDGVLLVSGGPGDVKIEAKPAYTYYPSINPDNAKEVLEEALAWSRDWGDERVVRVDRFETGWIYREAYFLDGEKIRQRLPDIDVEEMSGKPVAERVNLDVNTLIHVPNNPCSNSYFGASDFAGGLVTLFDEINERTSQIARILDKHSAPKMAGPKLFLDKDGNHKVRDYFETVDGQAPKYITWDAQLQAAFMHLDRIEDKIFAMAEVSKALAFLAQGARYDSGPAFRMQLAQTLAKANRKRLYLDYGIKEVIQTAVALYLGQRYEDTPEPNVRWRDGLPKDLSQDSQTENNRIASKTTSRVDAIRRLDDCDEATARATLAEIQAEEEVLGGVEMPPIIDTSIEREAEILD